MIKKKSALFFIVLGFFLNSFNAQSLEIENLSIYRKIIDIKEASAPRIIDNYLLFTFESSEKPAFVGAAFDFDNYTKIHQYKMLKNEGNEVFFLLIDLPRKESIKYRIIVDGIWMPDPYCSGITQDAKYVELSHLRLPVKPDSERIYPYTSNGVTHFYFSGEENINVNLAGSFNGWDPFMYRMIEKNPGEYYFSTRLPPGTHYYYFIAAGKVITDSRNPYYSWDRNSNQVSQFVLK